MNKSFSIQEAFAWAWKTMSANYGIIFLVILTMAIPAWLITSLTPYGLWPQSLSLQHLVIQNPLLFIGIFWLALTCLTLLAIGLMKLYLALYDNKTISYQQFLSSCLDGRLLLKILGFACIISLVLLGYMALLFGKFHVLIMYYPQYAYLLQPGFLMSKTFNVILWVPFTLIFTKFIFAYLNLFDNNGVIEAFKNSWALTQGVYFKTLLFLILFLIISSIGSYSILGIFVTAPLCWLALVHVYRSLMKQTQLSG